MKILQISITGKIFEGNLISRILKQNKKIIEQKIQKIKIQKKRKKILHEIRQ
jgi:hypothetical protein